MRDREITAEAVRALAGIPNLFAEQVSTPDSDADFGLGDLWLQVTSPQGEQLYAVAAEPRLSQSTLDVAIAQFQERARRWQEEGDGVDWKPLLVAGQVSDAVADELMAAGLEFADAAGNAYLDSRVGYILVLGRRRERIDVRDPFTPAGLKVAHALLSDRSLLAKGYRDIARAAGVSLGAVGYAIRALLEDQYLFKGKSGALHMSDVERLTERWELGYAERLRPSLAPSSWRLARGQLEGLLDTSRQFAAVVGGELAAAELGMPLRPQTATMYLPKEIRKEFAVAGRLLPTETRADAQVFLLDALSGEPTGGTFTLADPLLVRAELLAIGGDRLRAIADEIRITLLSEKSDD